MRYPIIILFSLALIFCDRAADYLPEQFAGMERSNYLSGPAAKQFVDKMHHKSVTPENNEIGFYTGENGKATIYITHYLSNDEARAEYEKMIEKISPENSAFMGGEIMEIEGRSVYRCFGMGQTHFVFYRDKKLFWLSLNTMRANKLLGEYFALIGG